MAKKNGKKSVTTVPGLARLMQEEFLRVKKFNPISTANNRCP